MFVYEVIYDHQYEGRSYGLFSTLDKAKSFLKKTLNVDLLSEKSYNDGKIIIYENNYRIEEKTVVY